VSLRELPHSVLSQHVKFLLQKCWYSLTATNDNTKEVANYAMMAIPSVSVKRPTTHRDTVVAAVGRLDARDQTKQNIHDCRHPKVIQQPINKVSPRLQKVHHLSNDTTQEPMKTPAVRSYTSLLSALWPTLSDISMLAHDMTFRGSFCP